MTELPFVRRVRMTRRGILGAVAGGGALVASARAQGAWPSRPIRMVVPFPPGGLVDTLARAVSQHLGGQLG
mgnify:CR=1 FL=1